MIKSSLGEKRSYLAYNPRLQSITKGKVRQGHQVASHITYTVKNREKEIHLCMVKAQLRECCLSQCPGSS